LIAFGPEPNISRAMGFVSMELDQFSSRIIKAAIAVHKELGPGLLESVYQKCMFMEIK
jgi:hypothetical protein